MTEQEIQALKDECNALAAHNREMALACKLAIDVFIANDCNVPNTIETLQDAIESTPQQCLLDVKAEAGRAGFIEGVRQMCENEIGWFDHDAESCANHYATKVRQGGE